MQLKRRFRSNRPASAAAVFCLRGAWGTAGADPPHGRTDPRGFEGQLAPRHQEAKASQPSWAPPRQPKEGPTMAKSHNGPSSRRPEQRLARQPGRSARRPFSAETRRLAASRARLGSAISGWMWMSRRRSAGRTGARARSSWCWPPWAPARRSPIGSMPTRWGSRCDGVSVRLERPARPARLLRRRRAGPAGLQRRDAPSSPSTARPRPRISSG